MEENVKNTHLTEAMVDGDEATYDEEAKELLSDKNLLAHILAGVVSEFEGWMPDEIIPCIEGEPIVTKAQKKIMPCISGANTESNSVEDGKITYDIRFNVIIPVENGEDRTISIKLLIDVDMQAEGTGLGYSLINRAIYSASRMISSQKNTEFINSDFDNIKKVYSIWICANPLARYRNTILRYSLKEDVIFGKISPSEIRSLMNIVMINLDGYNDLSKNEKETPTLIGLLNTIFTSPLSSEEKLKKLEDVYNIPRTEKIKEGVVKMCNLSSGILKKGIAEGKAEGIEQGKAEGEALGLIKGEIKSMYTRNKMSAQEIADELNRPLKFVQEVINSLSI